LEIPFRYRIGGLQEERARVIERLAIRTGETCAVELGDSLPHVILQALDLAPQSSLLGIGFTRLQRWHGGRNLRFGRVRLISNTAGRGFRPHHAVRPVFRLGNRWLLGRRRGRRFRRRCGLFDGHELCRRISCLDRRRGLRRHVYDSQGSLSRRAAPDEQRQAAAHEWQGSVFHVNRNFTTLSPTAQPI